MSADDILSTLGSMHPKELYSEEFQMLSRSAVKMLAKEYKVPIKFEQIDDEYWRQNYKYRPPVITIMGHVDHGKTTLLDAFRQSNRVTEEFGKMTQSIGAFTFVTQHKKHEVTCIDTPGH